MGVLYLPADGIDLDFYDQCLDLQPMKTWEHRMGGQTELISIPVHVTTVTDAIAGACETAFAAIV